MQLLGLDATGVAGSTGWRVDSNLLRSSIRRLRGMCTHPQVSILFYVLTILLSPFLGWNIVQARSAQDDECRFRGKFYQVMFAPFLSHLETLDDERSKLEEFHRGMENQGEAPP